MNSFMGEYIDDFVLVYLVEILVFSSTEHEHKNHLRLGFKYNALTACTLGAGELSAKQVA